MIKTFDLSSWLAAVPDSVSGIITGASAVLLLVLVIRIAMLSERKRQVRLHESLWKLKEGQFQQSLSRGQDEVDRLTDELYAVSSQLKSKEAALHDLELAAQAQRIRYEEQENALAAGKELLLKQRELMSGEFELLANRLFDAKQEQFTLSAKVNLEQVIAPFHNQLRDFYQRVDDAQKSDTAQRNQLIGQISALQQQSQRISADAANLANALKGNNKLMGNWGEIVLSRLLEQSGLTEGREYSPQLSDRNTDGKRLQPDIIVHLPDERDVVIDAKVSLLSFERYVNSGTKDAAKLALKGHVESVRAHVKSLASKRYEDLKGVRSLDFVFMFIPVEAAFLAVVQQHPEVLEEAYRRNIVVTGPSSLMIALKTVEALWQRKKQEQNVDEMVASAGKLYDQFVLFAESLQEVGAGLARAGEAHDSAMRRLCEGRGNLLKRVEDLKSLGARTSRQMPAALLHRSTQAPAAATTARAEAEDL